MVCIISLRNPATVSVPPLRCISSRTRPCAAAPSAASAASPAGRAPDWTYSIALRPARRPNTSSSVSEFEPSRLAPLMLTQAHSPAANSPGSGVAALMSVWMPPIM